MIADNQDNRFRHKELTAKIIECFYGVRNKLGYGFLEFENGTQMQKGG
jgi:hypothetical protein